jgi:predicted ATPase
MSKFIEAIQFQKDFRCYKAGETFEFKPGINLLVGDQGSGKSSMFYSIMNFEKSGIALKYDPDSSYAFIDTETMNPRRLDAFKHNRPDFMSIMEMENHETRSAANYMKNDYGRKSHGQVMLPFLTDIKENGKTLFIDEPEAGLSIRSQNKLWKHFKRLEKNNQLIIATHSQVFMEKAKEVLSLEHKKWMKTPEFLISQK